MVHADVVFDCVLVGSVRLLLSSVSPCHCLSASTLLHSISGTHSAVHIMSIRQMYIEWYLQLISGLDQGIDLTLHNVDPFTQAVSFTL